MILFILARFFPPAYYWRNSFSFLNGELRMFVYAPIKTCTGRIENNLDVAVLEYEMLTENNFKTNVVSKLVEHYNVVFCLHSP